MDATLSLALLSFGAPLQDGGPAGEALAPQSFFGWSSAWVGDLDGDGQEDLAASDHSLQGKDPEEGSGIVALLSGKDGSLLGVLHHRAGDFEYGRCLASIGVREGTDEQCLAIAGSRMGASGKPVGFVRIAGIRTDETLFEFEGTARFGEVLAAGKDVDRDGVLDYAVGSPAWDAAGACAVYSGREHKLLWKVECGGPGSRSCAALALVGDLDGDGGADVAIGNAGLAWHEENVSAVELRSGISGKAIRVIREPKRVRAFGSAIADLGDVDGDGRSDLAIGAPAGTSLPKWKEYPKRAFHPNAFGYWLPTPRSSGPSRTRSPSGRPLPPAAVSWAIRSERHWPSSKAATERRACS